MRSLIPATTALLLGLTVLLAPAAPTADAGGKGSDIGGPKDGRARARRRFGVDPASLSDEEKQARLDSIMKEYEGLRRNQDILQVRTRRNRVIFVGQMRYPGSAKFLKKVFDGDRDIRTQVAALVAIGQAGDFDIIRSAVKKCQALAKKRSVFALSLPRMFKNVDNPEAREWLLGRLSSKDPWVLAALVEAVGYTENPAAVDVLAKLYDKHKDLAVKFECLRALGRCGREKGVPKLLAQLGHEDWQLRMACAEGLGYAGETRVLPELKRLIIDGEEPIVVETATEAVAMLGTKEAIPLLIKCLEVGRLRARNKARHALSDLAQNIYRQKKDYFTDPHAWSQWWKRVQKPGFVGVGQTPVAREDERETVSYYGFKIHSDRVLFILDVSGSMKWPDAPRQSGIKPADWKHRRIDLAHRELFTTLRQLRKETLFNVATFAGVVTPWRPKGEVVATEENIEKAVKWIKRQLPRGGTATYDALEYGVLRSNVDTVYFLSDGVPSLGRYEERETILAEIRKANRYRRVSINTVALIVGKAPIESVLKYEDPEEMAEFMGRIAEENYGQFADESRP